MGIKLTQVADLTEEKVLDAIDSAQIHLSVGDCDRALELLEEVGEQNKNVDWLQAKASAYACKAGYNLINLFENDLTKIGSPSEFGGFARFTTSTSAPSDLRICS